VKNKLEHEIERAESKIKEYEDNKEAIENIEDLMLEKGRVINIIANAEKQLEICRSETLELYKLHGSLEQKLKNLIDVKNELTLLRQEYAAYDLFQKCTHSGGISYDIIKKKLPVINNEIAKVLANVVDFEIFFEEEGRRLNIFIKHPNFDPRPLEMGSGAEKTIAAMAIRLALLSVSNLPKPSLFILDEPGSALDETNMEGFIRILDMVKSYFKTVLLISHLDSLKDIVDTQLSIEKNGEFAYVRHS
jgi:DNA repair exonuclease SbcCD ATPase subunit